MQYNIVKCDAENPFWPSSASCWPFRQEKLQQNDDGDDDDGGDGGDDSDDDCDEVGDDDGGHSSK